MIFMYRFFLLLFSDIAILLLGFSAALSRSRCEYSAFSWLRFSSNIKQCSTNLFFGMSGGLLSSTITTFSVLSTSFFRLLRQSMNIKTSRMMAVSNPKIRPNNKGKYDHSDAGNKNAYKIFRKIKNILNYYVSRIKLTEYLDMQSP